MQAFGHVGVGKNMVREKLIVDRGKTKSIPHACHPSIHGPGTRETFYVDELLCPFFFVLSPPYVGLQ